jgi:hypothetical protein
MNSKIITLLCVLSYDANQGNSCVLSSNNSKIVLPFIVIEHPKTLKNEIRYNIKKILDSKDYSFDVSNIVISYLDIQNDLAIDYLTESNHNNDYNQDTDMVLLCGVVLEKKYKTNLHWIKTNITEDMMQKQKIDFLIDHIVQGTII